MPTTITMSLDIYLKMCDKFGKDNIDVISLGKINGTLIYSIVPTEEHKVYLNNQQEDDGREMSVTELLADALSNIDGLKKANAELNMENLQLQDNYGKAFNAGIAEGKAQSSESTEEFWTKLEYICNNEPEEIAVDIGDNVVDDFTGFTGIVTRVTEFADGSFQCMVERKGDAKALWFELDRLREV